MLFRLQVATVKLTMIGFKKNVGLILGFGGVILFGDTLPATRLTVAAIDPPLLAPARAGIADIAGLAVLLVLRRPMPPPHCGASCSWLA